MRSCVGPDEHAAELGVVAAAERVGEDAAADAVARLEHDHRAARRDDLARRREPGEPGADDDHVGGARARRRLAGPRQRSGRRARRRGAEQAAPGEALAHPACTILLQPVRWTVIGPSLVTRRSTLQPTPARLGLIVTSETFAAVRSMRLFLTRRQRRAPRLVLARERERAEVAGGERARAVLRAGGERVVRAERVRVRVELALAGAAGARVREPVRVVGDEAEVGVVEARVDDVGDVRRVAVDLRRAEELRPPARTGRGSRA